MQQLLRVGVRGGLGYGWMPRPVNVQNIIFYQLKLGFLYFEKFQRRDLAKKCLAQFREMAFITGKCAITQDDSVNSHENIEHVLTMCHQQQ